MRVVSTRTTRAPASTWVSIFLFFSLVCLLVFSFLTLSIFCNDIGLVDIEIVLTSCTVSFVFPSFLSFPLMTSDRCLVKSDYAVGIIFFFLFSFLDFFLVCSPSDRRVNTEWSFFIPKDLVIRVLFFLHPLYLFSPQILLLYNLHPCLSSPMPIFENWY